MNETALIISCVLAVLVSVGGVPRNHHLSQGERESEASKPEQVDTASDTSVAELKQKGEEPQIRLRRRRIPFTCPDGYLPFKGVCTAEDDPNACPTGMSLASDPYGSGVCNCLRGYSHWPADGTCYPALQQGPCPAGQNLAAAADQHSSLCVHNPCDREGSRLWQGPDGADCFPLRQPWFGCESVKMLSLDTARRQLICNSAQPHSNSEQLHSNREQPHSNSEKLHSGGEQPHSNSEQLHSNREQPHSNSEKPHSNSEQLHSSSEKPRQRAVFDIRKGYCPRGTRLDFMGRCRRIILQKFRRYRK